jgi:Lar family restriction alleviation protein
MILQPLPCPFCGGEPHVTKALNEVWVRCSQCNSSNGLSTADEAKAIAAWNRRSIPAGYVPMPRIPTKDMKDTFIHTLYNFGFESAYSDMLAAKEK